MTAWVRHVVAEVLEAQGWVEKLADLQRQAVHPYPAYVRSVIATQQGMADHWMNVLRQEPAANDE